MRLTKSKTPLLLVLVVLVIFIGSAKKTWAASEIFEVNVPISQSGTKQQLNYTVSALEEKTPLPTGLDEENSFNLTGKSSLYLHFTYFEPGIYHYAIKPTLSKNKLKFSDTQVQFILEVSVYYGDNGLQAIQTAKNADGNKMAGLDFSPLDPAELAEKNDSKIIHGVPASGTRLPQTGEQTFTFGSLIGLILLVVVVGVYYRRKKKRTRNNGGEEVK